LASRPWTLKPPIRCTDWGVSPMWAMTGTSMAAMACDGLSRVFAAFELDRFGAALLDRPAGVPARLLDALLVAHLKGMFENQEAPLPAAGDHAGVVDHVLQVTGRVF